MILALALAASSPLDTDLPFALGTAIAYADDCRELGFRVGDPAAALGAMPEDARGATLDAARSASIVRARMAAPLPPSVRLEASRETCGLLADSALGSTLVRR